LISEPSPPLPSGAIDRLLSFRPLFSTSEPLYSVSDEFSFDPFTYDPEVHRFIKTVYETGFLFSFEWVAWKDEAARLVHTDGAISVCTLDDLRRLITIIIRQDRFVSGMVAQAIDEGWFRMILDRLATLRTDISPNPS
jgi:hypothetical protein